MSIDFQKNLKKDINYIRRTLDKYVDYKIYNRSDSQKSFLSRFNETIEFFRIKYKITSSLFIALTVLLILFILILFYIAFKVNSPLPQWIIIILSFYLNLLILLELLFGVFLVINFIIKPILQIRKNISDKRDKYYNKEVKLYKANIDTNAAVKIGTIVSKDACNIIIEEINSLIILKMKDRKYYFILLIFIIMFTALYIPLSFGIIPNNSFKKIISSDLDDLRNWISFAIIFYGFLAGLVALYINREPKEIVIYRQFISILKRAKNIAK